MDNVFYDLESDPHELNNLVEHPNLQDQIASLRTKLDQWAHQKSGMDATPESKEIATARDEQMTNQFSKWMQEKGSSAEIDNLTYLE